MHVLAAIARELHAAEEQLRPVRCIRVTPLALEGSVTLVPMTPERARATERLLMTPRGVVADPNSERLVEILIHPGDWMRALKEAPISGEVQLAPTGRASVYGVPVV